MANVIPNGCNQEAIYVPAPDPCQGSCTLESLSVTENGLYVPSEGVDGFDSVDVNVSGGGNRFLKYDWDFKTSLVDSISGATATLLGGALQTSDGISIPSARSYIAVPSYVKAMMEELVPVTIEVDIGAMSYGGSAGSHHRLLMTAASDGFVYRSSGVWSLYAGSWATDSIITDFDYFANSTLKVVIDANNYWHIYKDGVLVYEPNIAWSMRTSDNIIIGSSSNSCYNAVIEALRIEVQG